MFTFSVKLEKWSFHVADLPRTGKKCTEMITAREGRAKLLFCFIKPGFHIVVSVVFVVCSTKKNHRTDGIYSISDNKFYLSFLLAWFPYRCISRICRVCRTKKTHRTDRIHFISYNKCVYVVSFVLSICTRGFHKVISVL